MPRGRQLLLPRWRHVCGTPSRLVDDDRDLGAVLAHRQGENSRRAILSGSARGDRQQTTISTVLRPAFEGGGFFPRRSFFTRSEYPFNYDYQHWVTVFAGNIAQE